MAKGNMNKATGSIGSLTMYKLGHQEVIRFKSAKPKNPRTPAQMCHRMKIRQAGLFARTMKQFIMVGYQATELDHPYSEARQHLIKNCFTCTDNIPVLDYSKIRISRGLIPAPENCTLTIEDNMVKISWKVLASDSKRRQHDKAIIVLYSGYEDSATGMKAPVEALRRDGSLSFPVPAHETPQHLWLFFHNPEEAVGESRKNISDSVYIGYFG